jgi:hypothetical protein
VVLCLPSGELVAGGGGDGRREGGGGTSELLDPCMPRVAIERPMWPSQTACMGFPARSIVATALAIAERLCRFPKGPARAASGHEGLVSLVCQRVVMWSDIMQQ